MLRIYFLQQWFNLSDPGAEEALYESVSMCRFVGIELRPKPVPETRPVLFIGWWAATPSDFRRQLN